MEASRLRLEIGGVVQGVGFRPFVYRLARELGLRGWVCNSAAGASLELEGSEAALEGFLRRLPREKPPHAEIARLEVRKIPARGEGDFEIRPSLAGEKTAAILPDLATCEACLAELFDPADRRYRYPFLNCTRCGPRFSILEALPYDRANTTMRGFARCEACRAEYEDPRDRRFHAQPIACPRCGPSLEYWDAEGRARAAREEALQCAVRAVKAGKILALKGLGGFHLIADARNEESLARLRRRKSREEKPFALMFPSLTALREAAEVSELEASWLQSAEAPIVLLRRRAAAGLSTAVAPGNPYLGAMLPYTPLHHLLMVELGFPVVATSGNRAEEPICTREADALERLGGIAEAFLVHDRPIARPVDDSILRVMAGREMLLRRSRGFAPLPVAVSVSRPVLALGAHLKDTVALGVADRIYVSQHLGDLQTPQALDAFAEATERLQACYESRPETVACDLHPDYASTHFAERLGRPLRRVQHHHAHVVSCMAEHGLEGRVLGVAWDGLGYGPDGTLWGGEFLRATRAGFERAGHFLPFPLPGGERALREPRRVALGLLYEALGPAGLSAFKGPLRAAFSPKEWKLLAEMLEKGLQCPRSSSVGRLFDAVAALIGLRQLQNFEGQAAMELEFLCEEADDIPGYSLEARPDREGFVLDWRPMVAEILADLEQGTSRARIARRFHGGLVGGLLHAARLAGERRVVLTGGCFQNKFLLEAALRRLGEAGFEPYWHWSIPPNDGGISLGQAAVVAAQDRG